MTNEENDEIVISAQRLRNLTTGILHTNGAHLSEDAGKILGRRVQTNATPNAVAAILPWLQYHAPDEQLRNGLLDQLHTGEYVLPAPTDAENRWMNGRFEEYQEAHFVKEIKPDLDEIEAERPVYEVWFMWASQSSAYRGMSTWERATAKRLADEYIDKYADDVEKNQVTIEIREGKAYQINGEWYARSSFIAPSDADMIATGDDNESN